MYPFLYLGVMSPTLRLYDLNNSSLCTEKAVSEKGSVRAGPRRGSQVPRLFPGDSSGTGERLRASVS